LVLHLGQVSIAQSVEHAIELQRLPDAVVARIETGGRDVLRCEELQEISCMSPGETDLHEEWASAWGLGLIIVTGLIPLAIFKWRNWV